MELFKSSTVAPDTVKVLAGRRDSASVEPFRTVHCYPSHQYRDPLNVTCSQQTSNVVLCSVVKQFVMRSCCHLSWQYCSGGNQACSQCDRSLSQSDWLSPRVTCRTHMQTGPLLFITPGPAAFLNKEDSKGLPFSLSFWSCSVQYVSLILPRVLLVFTYIYNTFMLLYPALCSNFIKANFCTFHSTSCLPITIWLPITVLKSFL